MQPSSPPSPPHAPPPASAQCTQTLQPAQPGVPPQQSPMSVFQSSDGKMRVDSGNTSIITDPKAGVSTVLNHATKQVQTVPLKPPTMPQLPGMPKIPTFPGLPQVKPPTPPALPGVTAPTAPTPPTMPSASAPPPPTGSVQDLGKSVIEGEEAQGKRFIAGEHTMETWTSTKTKLPVLTTMSGPGGQQICKCKTTPGEPDPSMFTIPADYTQIKPPKPPQMPKLP